MRTLITFTLCFALTLSVAAIAEPTKPPTAAAAVSKTLADASGKPPKKMPNKAPSGAMSSDAAKKMFADVCSKCHGPTGRGMASFPRLSDKKKDFLVGRLKQYRAGEKVGPNTPLMAPHAVKLSDAQIDGLATYIATVLSTK